MTKDAGRRERDFFFRFVLEERAEAQGGLGQTTDPAPHPTTRGSAASARRRR